MGKKICQSCGMPLRKTTDFGSEKDGSASPLYCHYCFLMGQFTDEGMTLPERMEKSITMAINQGMSETEAEKLAQEILPNLERWK